MSVGKDLFLAQQALVTLFSVTNKLQMQGDKYLQDLTIRQMLAIPAIIHAPEGAATINHIAKNLGTTKQSAKHIVDSMEKKEYLSIAPNEQDRRAVNVTVTPEGKEAFKVCSERTDEFLTDIFHDFTTEDLEMLWTLLKKLYGFDGIVQDGSEEHTHHTYHTAGHEDDILQYHQNFLKRRTDHYE